MISFPLSGKFSREKLEREKSLAQTIFKKHHKPRDEHRPICLCSDSKPQMQVYLHSNGFYHLKRNPRTGTLHHKLCPSYGETVESYGATDFLSAVTLDPDSKKRIRVSSPLTIAKKGEVAPGDEGGVKRSKREYKRASLKGFFEFLWNEIGLLDSNEEKNHYYSSIIDRIHKVSSSLRYNQTPVNDVLIIPNGLNHEQQREQLNKLSLSTNGFNPRTRVLLLGLLNRVEIDSSGRCMVWLYNTRNKVSIKYFTSENVAKRILRSVNIKDDLYEFNKNNDGYSWLIATAQPQASKDAKRTYPVINDAQVISVSDEHVPLSLGGTIE